MSLAGLEDPTAVGDAGVPGVVLDDPQQLVGHTIVGRFRVDGVLGLGGMGAVMRCHHLGLQRDIAVKILHPEMSTNAQIAARFAREAQTMSRMNHPNCVRVLDFGEFDVGGPSMQYLAMELLSGCELAELMLRPLGPERAMELMDQVFAGLEHAHAAGVVHRDLKPENVFVTTDHEDEELLKIVDFGIAKIVSGRGAKDNMTVAGTIFGTPKYMSPEQCAGGEIDERTDVYAAGVILYEMLAGHPPFDDANDPIQVIHKHILEPVPPLPSTVPAPLNQLVMGMLAKEKANRVQNITDARASMTEIRRNMANGTVMSLASATLLPSNPALATLNGPASAATTVAASFGSGRRPLAAAVALLVSLGTIAWLMRDSSESDSVEPESTAAAVTEDVEPEPAAPVPTPAALVGALASDVVPALIPGGPRASAEQLARLDALLADRKSEAVAESVRRLLDDYPKDERLHLRNARALRDSDAPKALAAYAKALELRPSLLDDAAVVEELLALMRRKEVEDTAIDLAIRHLGTHGLAYLLERVNDDARPVDYADRHRALRTIEDADRDSEINVELNLVLNLWQASEAQDRCKTFAGALDEIEREPAAYYLGSLDRVRAPKKCAGLDTRRIEVRDALAAQFVIDEADWVVPAGYANKKKRGGRRKGGVLRRLGLR